MSQNKSFNLVRSLYKDDLGNPFEMTPSQCELFDLIFKRKHPRNHIMTCTQFGKSLIVSLAVLTRAWSFPEKWCIVAPSQRKAKIIMGYIIQHLFDNKVMPKRLEVSKEESLERLRRERSKNRIVFKTDKGFSEIFILSAESKRIKAAEEALMGFGSPNIIEDESALIPDKIHSTAMRMLGGYIDNFLVKVGNPFRRNHFLRSYNDPKYHKFVVDWQKAVAEGRMTQSFIDEMRNESFFDVLYECKFPDADSADEGGWVPLLTEQEIRLAMGAGVHFGEERMGVDVATTGSNSSVIIKRSAGYAEVLFKSSKIDLMDFGGQIVLSSENINSRRLYLDSVGVGAGLFSRLREVNAVKKGLSIFGVNAGEQATDKKKFANKRAEMFWRLRGWLKSGGKLSKDDAWLELLNIRYKADSAGRLKIKPKELMLREGIQSPDLSDALSMTFYALPRNWLSAKERENKQFERRMRSKDKKRRKNIGGYALKMV